MNLVKKSINYVRAIAAETISNAGSGHTGVSLGAATILFTLFKDHYNFDTTDHDFLNRDRLVLSAGHASGLYYTLLSMFGFDITLADLKKYRSYGSNTPGHPEFGITDGVEASTGPLGQGIANAVGLAIASNVLAEKFNVVGSKIINNHTYCFCGDGCLMEGVANEAISLAGTLALNKLILLYDFNDVTIDGSLSMVNAENTAKKFKAMKWNVIKVRNGNEYSIVTSAIKKAKKSSKPTLIIFKTMIGLGTEKEGTSEIHGVALSKDELLVLKKKLKVSESFFIPTDVRDFCLTSSRRGKLNHEKWNQQLAIYENTHPELFKQFINFFDSSKVDFDKLLKSSTKWDNLSGRAMNSLVLNEISEKLSQLIGGTADVGPSTKCVINDGSNFSAGNRRGKNIHFGVREHAMSAICNGISLYDDFIPFCSTFMAFSNYLLPGLKMSAFMNRKILYFFTHDSVYVGEDGPTHQPIEQISQLRSIIGNTVFRPCDGKELLAGYKFALNNNGPTCFALSRQNMSVVNNTSFQEAQNGGYILVPSKKTACDVVIYASGSEVGLACKLSEELSKKYDVSIVSFPSLEVFENQTALYKNKVLQNEAKLKIVLEASNDARWYKYLDENDIFVGINEYQKSGNGETVYSKAGLNEKAILKLVQSKLK